MNDIKFERLTLDNIAFINDELIMDEDKYNIEDLKNFVSNNNNSPTSLVLHSSCPFYPTM